MLQSFLNTKIQNSHRAKCQDDTGGRAGTCCAKDKTCISTVGEAQDTIYRTD